jgi:hypothetical protein
MTRFLHSLLLLIARFTDKQLAQLVEYLLAENRCLRSKLPNGSRFIDTQNNVVLLKRFALNYRPSIGRPPDILFLTLNKLLKLGKPLGVKLKDIIPIVSYRSFLRWANEERPKVKPPKPGRPRKPEEIRELIIQMARDNGENVLQSTSCARSARSLGWTSRFLAVLSKINADFCFIQNKAAAKILFYTRFHSRVAGFDSLSRGLSQVAGPIHWTTTPTPFIRIRENDFLHNIT